MQYPIIDAHQHFWKYDPKRDTWMTDAMQVLHKDYLPPDISHVFIQNQISGSVLVQADPTESENQFLLGLAAENDFIKGVVGWIDLQSKDLEEKLIYYKNYPLMKGFRELLQDETKRDRMLNPDFQKGIGKLNKYGFSFDLQ
jgi:L-fuconolactonase